MDNEVAKHQYNEKTAKDYRPGKLEERNIYKRVKMRKMKTNFEFFMQEKIEKGKERKVKRK